jgi:NADH:ubiquinone oxidoreductase subunit B-like Fe-S oxidoreductase
VVKGADHVVLVDGVADVHHAPEALLHALITLQEKTLKEKLGDK